MSKFICQLITLGLSLLLWGNLWAAEPLQLHNTALDGQYIGKHIEFLNEENLFQIASQNWQVPQPYKEKMLSGELHSDDNFTFEWGLSELGFSATLSQPERDARHVISWGVNDAMNPEIASYFQSHAQDILRFNFSPHSYWLRLKLANASEQNVDLVIELDRPLFRNMEVFVVDVNGHLSKRSSITADLNDREIVYKNFSVSVSAPPGSSQVYFRVDGHYIDSIPLRVWSEQAFDQHVLLDIALLGFIAGGLALISLYNIATYVSTRQSSHLYLSLMAAIECILFLCGSGLGNQLFWPSNINTVVPLLYFAFPLSFVFFILFSKSFLDLARYAPKVDKFSTLMLVIFSLLLPLFFVLPDGAKVPLIGLMFLLGNIYFLPLVYPAFLAMKQGDKTGTYLLIGIGLLFFSNIEWLLTNLNLIPFDLLNYLNIKGLAIVVLMTYAMSEKLKSMKDQLARLNENLEAKVANRTVKLEKKSNELKVVNKRLLELDELKTQFFSNVSHELRTPLTLILSPIESLMNGFYGKLPESSTSPLQSIQRNTQRLLRLINDLLDFSKIESGNMELQISQHKIGEMVTYCVASMEHSAKAAGISVKLKDHSKGLVIQADHDLLEKAFFNLLSNAIKFNHDGGQIDIELNCDADSYSIQVTDSGIGIPEDKLDQIFERFSQVDSSNTRKHQGTGIGLSLTKEIIRLHGGTIQVKSQVGRGSTFNVTLPILLQATFSPQAAPLHAPLTASDQGQMIMPDKALENTSSLAAPTFIPNQDPSSKALLMVEDNKDMQAYLVDLLKPRYHLAVANNGEEALELLAVHEVDLILSDVAMPQMDGYQLTEAVRNSDQWTEIPIILLTAKADWPSNVQGIEGGANDYITKPFINEDVLARITSHLKFSALRHKLAVTNPQTNSKSVTEKTKEKINLVMHYILENYFEEMSRESLARLVDMSPDHLGRNFKKQVGEKISDYLNKVRIDNATERLKTTGDRVSVIAYDVGFGNLRSFNKAFLAATGKSPSDYRRELR